MFEDSRMRDLLKIKYQTFRTKRVAPDKPYENEHIIVRKGNLNTIDHALMNYVLRDPNVPGNVTIGAVGRGW